MDTNFTQQNTMLIWRLNGETLSVEPWGPDAVRVRATMHPHFADVPNALTEPPAGVVPQVSVHADRAELANGKLRVVVDTDGRLHFYHSQSGALLLEEPVRHFYNPPQRSFTPISSDLFHLEAGFA